MMGTAGFCPEAVEVLFVPQAILGEGWNDFRGLTARLGSMDECALDALQLPQWRIELRDCPRYWYRSEVRMVRSSEASLRVSWSLLG
jgi:hypothetical protein